MNIHADRTVCQGYANCLVTAPDYFDLDDEGRVAVLNSDIAQGDETVVEEAVGSCPVRALRLGIPS